MRRGKGEGLTFGEQEVSETTAVTEGTSDW